MQRMWVVDRAPARLVLETLHLPHTLVPPAAGSVLNIFTFPPDEAWKGKAGRRRSRGVLQIGGHARRFDLVAEGARIPTCRKRARSTSASCWKARSALVTGHAGSDPSRRASSSSREAPTTPWSNRSGRPAVVAIASHDAK
jgi:hypothetical protein